MTSMRGSTRGCSHTGRIVVLDTGAILSGLPLALGERMATTPDVVGEVRDPESRRVLSSALESGRLEVLEPGAEGYSDAYSAARESNVVRVLSRADVSVLALALKLRSEGCEVLVATDDYALQRCLSRAGIGLIRVRYKGIREQRG